MRPLNLTVDTWNQVYRAKNNETLSEIAEAFDISLRELQTHNEANALWD